MSDPLQQIIEAHNAQLEANKAQFGAFAAYIRQRDDKLAQIEASQSAILQALQSLRGEIRALTGQSPLRG